MQQKKTPMRKCLGCNEMKPKKELVRVVRAPDGSISVDLTGKKNGRGAYVCRSAECLKRALKGDRLQRAFACPIPPEIAETLLREIEANE